MKEYNLALKADVINLTRCKKKNRNTSQFAAFKLLLKVLHMYCFEIFTSDMYQ